MSEPRFVSTRVEPGARGQLVFERAELQVASGPDRGLACALGPASILIGTASDCELVLSDPTVSGHHAEVTMGNDRFHIRDLSSKNGLRVGGWPIDRAPLADGMRLQLGHTSLLVRSLGQTQSIPLAEPGRTHLLVAHSTKMRAAVGLLEQLAASEVTVLIEGETGTGKELASQTLHALSPRARGPFVVFDAGGVPRELIAAELFGHERGAFSGASAARAGLFEEADGGTIFLDEIGELPLDVQPLLLRAVESRTVRRLGATRDVRCDVRVVAATNRNLEAEVRAGRFRRDLYHRLAVGRVRLPSLRERAEDIVALAHQFAVENGIELKPEWTVLLSAYGWPGNVRELRNTVARLAVAPAAALAGLAPADAPAAELDPAGELPPLPEARRLSGEAFEKRYLEAALARAAGNVSRAAELAGISRQLLTRLIAKHQLRTRARDEK